MSSPPKNESVSKYKGALSGEVEKDVKNFRSVANSFFQKNKFNRAIKEYTLGIDHFYKVGFFVNRDEIILLLLNRGICYMRQKKFYYAFSDFLNAKFILSEILANKKGKFENPKNYALFIKVYIKYINCLKKIKWYKEAIINIEFIIPYIKRKRVYNITVENLRMDIKRLDKLRNKVETKIRKKVRKKIDSYKMDINKQRVDNMSKLRGFLEEEFMYPKTLNNIISESEMVKDEEYMSDKKRLGELKKELLATVDRIFSNNIEIDYREGRGTCLIAKRKIEKGELLFNDVCLFNAVMRRDYCSFCARRLVEKGKRCRLCSESFCSADCYEQADIIYHKKICDISYKGVQNVRNSSEKAIVTSGFLSLIMVKILGFIVNNEKYPCDPMTIHPFDKLSHCDYKKINVKRMYSNYLNVFTSLRLFGFPYLDIITFSKLFAVAMVNCFGFVYPDVAKDKDPDIAKKGIANHYGLGLWKNLCFVNHSCLYNCEFTLNQKTGSIAVVKAAKTIKKGEEITINYFGQTQLPFTEKKQVLNAQYGFTCNCYDCKFKEYVEELMDERDVKKDGKLKLVLECILNNQQIPSNLVDDPDVKQFLKQRLGDRMIYIQKDYKERQE